MGKKTETKKPAAPSKRGASTKPAAVATVVAPAAPAKKPKAASAKKAAAKPAAAKAKKPSYTHDDVALRAYFIAERRQAAGIHGTPQQDWVAAERELKLEAKGPRKRATRKS